MLNTASQESDSSSRADDGYQYFATGRTSIAPPRRAPGIREAIVIAASRLSASRVFRFRATTMSDLSRLANETPLS